MNKTATPIFHIVLFEPEIPPNTGNIIRLSANVGAKLHLIKPLGFEIDDKQLRRAGLDYKEWTTLEVHNNYEEFLKKAKPKRIFACSTKGKINYHFNDIHLSSCITQNNYEKEISCLMINIYLLYIELIS